MAKAVMGASIDVTNGDTYSDNEIDFRTSDNLGTSAKFLQLNSMENADCKVRITVGGSTAIFTLQGNATQIFNRGDVSISKLAFDNTASNGGGAVTVEYLAAR